LTPSLERICPQLHPSRRALLLLLLLGGELSHCWLQSRRLVLKQEVAAAKQLQVQQLSQSASLTRCFLSEACSQTAPAHSCGNEAGRALLLLLLLLTLHLGMVPRPLLVVRHKRGWQAHAAAAAKVPLMQYN
jgi:hypothetical protein